MGFTDTTAGPGTPAPPISPILGLAFIFIGSALLMTIALGAVGVGRFVVVSVALDDNDAEGEAGEGGESDMGSLDDMADSIWVCMVSCSFPSFTRSLLPFLSLSSSMDDIFWFFVTDIIPTPNP